MSRHLIAAVEAAYELSGSASVWLNQLLVAARPTLDAGLGAAALLVDTADPAAPKLLAAASLGFSDRAFRAIGPMVSLSANDDAAKARFSRAGPVSTVLTTFAGTNYLNALRQTHEDSGIADTLYVLAGDARGVSCVLISPQAAAKKPSSTRRTTLAQLAAHVATAHRLRQYQVESRSAVDAVLETDGRLAHAQGEATHANARAALRHAAILVLKARDGARSDGARALADWQALVSGRWSLVDQFDSDGRRFLVARRNDPKANPIRNLSERETQVARLAALGHPNKLIAYELGISLSSVGTHLGHALRKLGLRSRVELIRYLDPSPSADSR